jgi:hypothetical protein
VNSRNKFAREMRSVHVTIGLLLQIAVMLSKHEGEKEKTEVPLLSLCLNLSRGHNGAIKLFTIFSLC